MNHKQLRERLEKEITVEKSWNKRYWWIGVGPRVRIHDISTQDMALRQRLELIEFVLSVCAEPGATSPSQ